jgi:DNA-binding transcriptional LysR family regulator
VLFTRTKGMELTAAGKKLYNEISTSIEKIVEIDKSFSESKELVLGTYGTMLSKVLSSSIAEFYAENKDAKIITVTDNSKVLNFPKNCEDFDIAVLKNYPEKEYDTSKYGFIDLGKINYVLIANNKSDLCKKKKIKIEDLKNKIIYIPRGDNRSSKTFKKMIDDSKINVEVKRIDSVSMVQIIKDYNNCVGEANCLYLEKEIANKEVEVLDTAFKIPSSEIGIYYRKDNSSAELKKLIKIIKKRFLK